MVTSRSNVGDSGPGIIFFGCPVLAVWMGSTNRIQNIFEKKKQGPLREIADVVRAKLMRLFVVVFAQVELGWYQKQPTGRRHTHSRIWKPREWLSSKSYKRMQRASHRSRQPLCPQRVRRPFCIPFATFRVLTRCLQVVTRRLAHILSYPLSRGLRFTSSGVCPFQRPCLSRSRAYPPPAPWVYFRKSTGRGLHSTISFIYGIMSAGESLVAKHDTRSRWRRALATKLVLPYVTGSTCCVGGEFACPSAL